MKDFASHFFNNNSMKIRYLTVIFLSFLVFFLSVKYLLILIAPFFTAYILSNFTVPFKNFLANKLHFHKNTATFFSLLFVLGIFITIIYLLCSALFTQALLFIDNLPSIIDSVDNVFFNFLSQLSKKIASITCTPIRTIESTIYREINAFANSFSSNILPAFLNCSMCTIKCIFNAFIFIFVTFLALFYLTKDSLPIKNRLKNCIFRSELDMLYSLTNTVCKAYIRTQFVIMSIISVICFLALSIIKCPYALLFSVLLGLLDILPLIGVGTFLVPATIILYINGSYSYGTIIFIAFVMCLLTREILEPKLMGKHIGISPLTSLISIYVGYKLLSFLGMILGPFCYIFVRECIKLYAKNYKTVDI